jgi:hypothetical protein
MSAASDYVDVRYGEIRTAFAITNQLFTVGQQPRSSTQASNDSGLY